LSNYLQYKFSAISKLKLIASSFFTLKILFFLMNNQNNRKMTQ